MQVLPSSDNLVSIIEILWLYWSIAQAPALHPAVSQVSIIEILWLYWSSPALAGSGQQIEVSIIEILWLYWSCIRFRLYLSVCLLGFHNRNIMALLKPTLLGYVNTPKTQVSIIEILWLYWSFFSSHIWILPSGFP